MFHVKRSYGIVGRRASTLSVVSNCPRCPHIQLKMSYLRGALEMQPRCSPSNTSLLIKPVTIHAISNVKQDSKGWLFVSIVLPKIMTKISKRIHFRLFVRSWGRHELDWILGSLRKSLKLSGFEYATVEYAAARYMLALCYGKVFTASSHDSTKSSLQRSRNSKVLTGMEYKYKTIPCLLLMAFQKCMQRVRLQVDNT